MLAALGVGTGAGGSPAAAPALADLADDGLPGWPRRASGSAGVELVVASDVDVPLLGFHGASASSRRRKGRHARGGPAAGGAPSGG